MCNRLTPSSNGRTEPAFGNFNCPRQTLYKLFIKSFLHSAENAIIDSFQARRRLIES